ncbi:MAG: transposase [Chloroflexales bacterium]|nr:transposase [Chloroflexales bacterium]
MEVREFVDLTIAAVLEGCNGASSCPQIDEEQQLWSECSWLLANCVIYYNAAILSQVLEERRATSDLAGVALLCHLALSHA